VLYYGIGLWVINGVFLVDINAPRRLRAYAHCRKQQVRSEVFYRCLLTSRVIVKYDSLPILNLFISKCSEESLLS
jgi:hypothetical protein